MYRNCYYDVEKNKVFLWTWNADKERICVETDFSPYLYVQCEEHKKTADSIFGEPVRKMAFKNEWERKKFVENSNGNSYFNLPVEQLFLLEKFGELSIEKMTENPLKVFVFDIEVDCGDVFPDPKEAKFPVNVITVHDSLSQKFYVFGVKPYDVYSIKDSLGEQINVDKVEYIHCKDETDLFKSFLRFWRKDFPDVVIGWNSANFDIPYIMNRITTLYGEKKINVLSPVGKVRSRTATDKYGRENQEYTIEGVSLLDYMLLYRSYTLKELESVALNHVAQNELGIGKVEYNQVNLSHLAHEDWNKFVTYNIQDVNIILELEEKLKYLEIARFISNSGFCNIEKAIGKVAVITGILAQKALKNNQIIPTTKKKHDEEETISGGYVKVPVPGMYKDLCSFDANSLYPNIMITCNISPETKVGKIIKQTENKIELEYKGKKFTIDRDKIYDVLKNKKLAMSRAGILFSQEKKGIGPEFVDELYEKRKIHKNNMLKAKEEMSKIKDKKSAEFIKLKKQAVQENVTQQLYKVLLNSTFGVFANPHFGMFDLDCAESITLTGQGMIKQAEKICNAWAREQGETEDVIIYVDTDSCFLNMENLLKNVKKLDDEGNLTEEFLSIVDSCQKNLNLKIDKWAREKLGSLDPRFYFKMEKYTEKAILVKKKYYALLVKNDEGVKCNKMVIKGMLLVKSSISPVIRKLGKDIVMDIFNDKDKLYIKDKIHRIYEDFLKYPIDDIAFRISLKTMNNNKYKVGMKDLVADKSARIPSQVRCSYQYNHLIKELKLDNKYPLIENGMKVKMVYLNKNKYNLDRIAYITEFPEELEVEPDYEIAFQKTFLACLEPIYNVLNWEIPDVNHEAKNDLESIFS